MLSILGIERWVGPSVLTVGVVLVALRGAFARRVDAVALLAAISRADRRQIYIDEPTFGHEIDRFSTGAISAAFGTDR